LTSFIGKGHFVSFALFDHVIVGDDVTIHGNDDAGTGGQPVAAGIEGGDIDDGVGHFSGRFREVFHHAGRPGPGTVVDGGRLVGDQLHVIRNRHGGRNGLRQVVGLKQPKRKERANDGDRQIRKKVLHGLSNI
jgi:hypothetical protein